MSDGDDESMIKLVEFMCSRWLIGANRTWFDGIDKQKNTQKSKIELIDFSSSEAQSSYTHGSLAVRERFSKSILVERTWNASSAEHDTSEAHLIHHLIEMIVKWETKKECACWKKIESLKP